MDQVKGFFASLFDFSFSSFVTGKVIKVLYALSLIGIGITTLYLVITSFILSVVVGILMLLIGAPLFFLVSVIAARVWLEIIQIIFKMADDVAQIARR